jgi:hypothetical protein
VAGRAELRLTERLGFGRERTSRETGLDPDEGSATLFTTVPSKAGLNE